METNLDALIILLAKHAAKRSLRASVVRLKLLHISSGAVIPAPYYGVNSRGNPVQKYWIPGRARNDSQSGGTFGGLQ